MVQSSVLAASRASASAFARRYGRIASPPLSGSWAPIEETIRKRVTPAASAASTHFTAAPRSTRLLALRAGARAGARREHDRVGAGDVRRRVLALQVAHDGDAAVRLDVARVVGVADQAAGRVALGREQADEVAGHLPVPAGDQHVHVRSSLRRPRTDWEAQ